MTEEERRQERRAADYRAGKLIMGLNSVTGEVSYVPNAGSSIRRAQTQRPR